MCLEERHGGFFARKKRQFRAQVYLSEAMESLEANTVLSRRVEWQDKAYAPLTMEAIEEMEQIEAGKPRDAMQRLEAQKSFKRIRAAVEANEAIWRQVMGEFRQEEAHVATVIQTLMPDRP